MHNDDAILATKMRRVARRLNLKGKTRDLILVLDYSMIRYISAIRSRCWSKSIGSPSKNKHLLLSLFLLTSSMIIAIVL